MAAEADIILETRTKRLLLVQCTWMRGPSVGEATKTRDSLSELWNIDFAPPHPRQLVAVATRHPPIRIRIRQRVFHEVERTVRLNFLRRAHEPTERSAAHR
jgi:hypothetical protein